MLLQRLQILIYIYLYYLPFLFRFIIFAYSQQLTFDLQNVVKDRGGKQVSSPRIPQATLLQFWS